MAPTKTLGALLALLVVATGAAAAMPGAAPVDAPDQADNQTADAEEEAAQTVMNETAADERDADEERQAGGPPEEAAGERGPPADMPGAAPDFVSEIHATIQDHLSGAVEDLGAAISDITPGGEAGGDADEGMDQDDTDGSEMPDDAEETDQPAGTPA
jgi:hypothetical protein